MFPDGAITGDILSSIVSAILVVAAAWWRVDGVIREAKREALNAAEAADKRAALALAQLAEYRTHVAEHYASKSGMREMSDRITAGQDRLFGEVQRLHERMDRIVEARSEPKAPLKGAQL